MMRVFVPLALIGLAVVPDWATAFGWRLRCPAPQAAAPCPPRLVVVSPCLPLAIDACPPAQVVQQRPAEPRVYAEPQAAPAPAKPETPKADAPKPPSPGIPPDGGTGAGRSDAPPPADTKPDAKPAGFATPTPAIPTLPPSTEPKTLQVTPATAPPRDTTPAKPVSEAPKASETPVIPPLVPPMPGGNDSTIPPLSIPTAPNGTSTRVAESSPLGGGPTVDVFPVDGELPTPIARRTVGFFNHTDRDIKLTVDGESVTLPPRHSVTASVPAKFAWSMNGGPERKTEVPTAAPGIEVVIRK